MKGAVFVGDRRMEVRDFPKPEPGPGEVVLKMKASGLCGSDLMRYRLPASELTEPLRVAGHEPCGVVAEVGPGVTSVQVGDRVMMHHYTGCNACSMCRIGYTQMCLVHHEIYGATKDGGHQDYLLCPASTCVKMPDSLPFDQGAAVACGTGTAFHAVKRLGVAGVDTVAVFGQGPVGASAAMFAKAMGARVIAVDVIAERLALAAELGADVVIDASDTDAEAAIRDLTDGEGADATLDATGIPEVRRNALDSVRYWGRVCFVGEGNPTSFNVSDQIIHKQLTIYGSWTFSLSGLAEAANFVVDRAVPLGRLITHRYSLDQAVEAYALFDTGATGKPVIVWE